MARPWSARCYGVARQREGSRQNSIGGSGVLSLRHFGLVLFIPWRVGAEEAGAAKGRAKTASGPRVNPSCWPYARARRAATGRAACELWGLCARPLAIEIGEGGLVSLAPARLGRVSSYELSTFAAALTQVVALTRARGAPPRDEPPVSYGVSARGRSRSRLARGAWSRWLQLGSVEFRVMNYRHSPPR